jgi:hypothetical protein
VAIRGDAYPRLLSQRVVATLQASFPNQAAADRLERRIVDILNKTKTELALLSDRSPMSSRRINNTYQGAGLINLQSTRRSM